MRTRIHAVTVVSIFAVATPLFAMSASGDDAATFYKRNCGACHTIGAGRLLGPDLKNVEGRTARKWLIEFLMDPKATISAGDPYGKQMVAEAKGMVMPQVKGIDREMAGALPDYIASRSSDTSTKAAAATEKEYTAVDIALGQALVTESKGLRMAGRRASHAMDSPPLSCRVEAGWDPI